ncbi:penicillin acylase family protein [Bradyrhizobium prioriisuperbiae]|uniref:penicillin acylase family protein n=1 Tax=Bradyrhizobium prioriisuperbiae TaxID=2854389 RepID=UPI0028E1C3FB|nr:penicillin acylase family protein [Bradyrhizobium prioritasuperba]
MATEARSCLPQTSGTVTLRGLVDRVDVHRDAWGIPHVRAKGTADVFFAQGFVHAQDRLWQMDAARRRMLGRWAEWEGPAGVGADKLARQLDVAGASRRDFAGLGAEARAMLEAYAAGVNAYLAQGTPLPVEYGLVGGAPELWEPWHCIAVMRQRGYLMGSVWFKLWRAAALRTIGPEQVAKLRYDDGGEDLLGASPSAEAKRWIATLQDLAPAIDALTALAGPEATDGGSNNWAVAPSRTATGRPLLAGDPHRAFELPSMYSQCHLACDAFDAIGFSVPGVPAFPHFAHNGHVAFCVTHAFVDIHDVFVDKFSPDASQYLFKGKWQDTAIRRERIKVRDAADVDLDVVTTHHGPVITGDPRKGAALTLRSVQFAELDRSFDCLQPMLRAKGVDALYEATRGWGLIDHNLVSADTSGRIGNLVRAIVPRRPRLNGWLPVPGWTGDYEWQGDIPWEDMPRAFDPPSGFLVTANNRVAADDPENYLCTDCHPPYRARRIAERLAGLPAATVEDMAGIHADTVSLTAREFIARLGRLLTVEGPAAALRDLIIGWDAQMSADSKPAAAYARTRLELARIVLKRSGLGDVSRDPVAQVAPGIVPLNQVWWALPSLLRNDDTSLLGGWDWDRALATALERAAKLDHGETWSQLHHARMVHPLAASFPQAAAQLEPAGLAVGGDNDTVMANGCYWTTGLSATYGAVGRYVFDVGRWENSRWAVFHGASGHPASPHYADQHPLWASAKMVPMLYDWSVIAKEGDRLVLQPA